MKGYKIRYLVNGEWTTKCPKDFSEVQGVDEVMTMNKKDFRALSKVKFADRLPTSSK